MNDMRAHAPTAGPLPKRLGALLVRATDACMPPGLRDPSFAWRARRAIGVMGVAIPVLVLAALAQGLGFGDLDTAFGPWLPALSLAAALGMGGALVLLRVSARLTTSVCLAAACVAGLDALAVHATGGARSPLVFVLLALPLALLLTA